MIETNRTKAEAHWEYTKGIIDKTTTWVSPAEQVIAKSMERDEWMALCKHLYVEGMIHGYKHGREDYEGKS